MDRLDGFLILLLAVSLAAALVLAVGRADIELANRTVEIIVDADDARTISAASGISMPDLLADLREAGATALAVREVTVGELAASGRLLIVSQYAQTSLAAPDPVLAGVLAAAINARLPHARPEPGRVSYILTFDIPADQLAPVPVLLRPEDLGAARAANIRIIARPLNFPAASPRAIDAAAAEARAAGARLVIFGGDEVLGYDSLLPDTARAFRRNDLLFGFVEMASQRGDETLANLLTDRLVRVHSISDSDMAAIAPEIAVRRYARAVRERNIRACYVRLLLRPSPDPAAANIAYVGQIADALRADGARIGPPGPYQAPEGWPPRWPRVLVALGLAPAFALLLRRFLPLKTIWPCLILVLVLLAGLALRALRPNLVVPVGGLAAAIIFPTLGLLWVIQRALPSPARPPTARLVGIALLALLVASAVSAAGGLLIVGLYSRVGHLMAVERFAGVKLAHIVPVVLLLAACLAHLPGRPEPFRLWWTRVRLRLAQSLGRPVTILEALLILLALGALAFALTRTGNQPLVPPTAAEIKLRDLLESLLAIRPRTKEFLLGHPALMLAIALAARGRRTWLPLVVLLAAVGQVSLLNSFCHLHTPLHITLIRTTHGLWIGAAIGIVLLLLWRLLLDRPPRKPLP